MFYSENKNGIFELAYGDSDENGVIDIVAIDKNEDKNAIHYKGVEILGYYCKNNKGDWIS